MDEKNKIYTECDTFGCWYYFLWLDKEKQHFIDLSYHELGLTSGYSVFDWVERCT